MCWTSRFPNSRDTKRVTLWLALSAIVLSGCSSRMIVKPIEVTAKATVKTGEATSKILMGVVTGVEKGIGALTPDKPSIPEGAQVGIASWYGPGYHGKRTANGEIYNMYGLTAAHNTFPFDTKVNVTNLSNGRNVTVRINDRGPFVDQRIIDLSYRAAQELDMVEKGVQEVSIAVVQ